MQFAITVAGALKACQQAESRNYLESDHLHLFPSKNLVVLRVGIIKHKASVFVLYFRLYYNSTLFSVVDEKDYKPA